MASSRKLHRIESGLTALTTAVTECLARHVGAGDRVVVALSGGIDSVCLLHVITSVVRTGALPLELAALHVHHGLSLYADEWAAFCLEYCAALGLPCTCVHVAVNRNSKSGLEGAARQARHAVFNNAVADWVILAHQRSDQAETLLFNLLRGTGIAGAAAMRERKGRLLRPFLSISRDEIEFYARHHGLTWCEDESNADQRHTRNFLRRRVFPELEQRFPAAAANFASAAARFAEASDLLDELACADLPAGQTCFPVLIDVLRALSEVRARNVLRFLLAKSHVQIPSEARLRETLRQMLAAEADRHPAVVFGQHCLRRRRGWIYLEPVGGCADSN